MNQQLRTPETCYFDHEYIRFKKINGIIHYEVWAWLPDGITSYIKHKGTVETQEQLDTLLNLGSVME